MSGRVETLGSLVRGARLRFRYIYLQQDEIDPMQRDPMMRRRLLLSAMRRITDGLAQAQRLFAAGDVPAMLRVLRGLQY